MYSPLKSRDLDLLIVIDKLIDIREKQQLEIEIIKCLEQEELSKPVDLVVLDIEILKENAKPGGVISGLILGYKPLYDELGIPTMIEKMLQEISEEEGYVIIKDNKRLNLTSLAKIKKQLKRYEHS